MKIEIEYNQGELECLAIDAVQAKFPAPPGQHWTAHLASYPPHMELKLELNEVPTKEATNG